ncbi:ComEC/Rec2 family competence protein [uncultured Schumannella sp.]|uniref:ComEC/Rec2 family competence protein n=1 Tax=uncultured Schumannella sp. TaxID=1195956 RepID=UPI0025E2F9B7|nr:ComEC/Rec2 family competence protein [uncultured Schumannella sp.]
MPGDYRLVPAALVAWLGAILAVGVTDPAAVLAAAIAGWAAVIVLAVAVFTLRASPRARARLGAVLLAAAAASLVLSATANAVAVRAPAELREAAQAGRTLELELTLTSRPSQGRFEATLGSIAGVRESVSAIPVLVFAERDDPALARLTVGSTVRVLASVTAAEPGDDRAYLAFARGELDTVAEPPPLLAASDALRTGFRQATAALPQPGGGLLPGLAIGDTSDVGATLDRDMKRSSLSHLTAVSGANCAVVVVLVFGVCRIAGAPRAVRVGAALVALLGFVVLVTPEPSVLRASIMAGAALVGLALGRASRGMPLLCLSVIVLVTIDPWLARNYGFALSVLATAGLLVLAGPLAERLSRVVPIPLALVVAVPTAAQLACQPILVLLDPSLAVYGVPANVLAAPAAPIATVVGLVACLVLPVAPWLAQLLIGVAWLPSSWIAAVAHTTAALPVARGPWIDGVAGVVLLAAVTVAAAVLILPTGGRASAVRRGAAGVLALTLLAYPLTLVANGIGSALGRPSNWQYAMCDVGQGDATLIRSGGQVALVDVGREAEPLAACLEALGVARIDLLVLTHFDIDHVGGLDAVLGRVDRALLGVPADAADVAVGDALRAHGASVESPVRGVQGVLGELAWEVVWPPPRGVDPGNDASLVLDVRPVGECRAGCLSAILLGDLGEQAQARLLASAHPASVDVVKVSHHGSGDQSEAMYASLGARVGLIGVGADNEYGHPTESALGMLAAAGTWAYRTDQHGIVLVAPGEAIGEIVVWTERLGDGPGG